MEEITVRVWNKETQRMLEPETLLQMLRVEHDNGIAEGRIGMPRYGVDTEKQQYSHLIFMQYTGLEDKNGKEVYVGDIIHHKIGDYWHKLYIEDLFCNPILYAYIDIDKLNYIQGDYEVLGNIYENPELWKGEK